VIVAKSVLHPDCPPDKGYVRGEIDIGGYVLTPVDGNTRTQITSVTKLDLKGSIPGFVMAKVMQEQPLTIDKMRTVIMKNR
jgi:hypothetical protein